MPSAQKKYAGFYETNRISYTYKPCLVNSSLYRHITEQGIIKGFCGLN